jgi:hypothetical protein
VSSQPFAVPAVHRPHVCRPCVCRPCRLLSLLFVSAIRHPCVHRSPFLVFPRCSLFPFPVVRCPIPHCSSFPAVLHSLPLLFPAIHHLLFVGLVPPVCCSLLFVIGAIRCRQHLHIPLRAVARRKVGGTV